MQSLNFTLDGLSTEEFERRLDIAIALNDPAAAIQKVRALIYKHNIRCIEVDEYLKKTADDIDIPYRRTPEFLIYGTYFRIKACAREREQFLDPDFNINRFQIWNIERSGPLCQKFANKKYKKSNLPELPHNPGCSCMLSPIF